MGGSFNPAHDGHRYISQLALARLGLNEVWWLVSPQNPLKPEIGMAPFESRLESVTSQGDKVIIDIILIDKTSTAVEILVGRNGSTKKSEYIWDEMILEAKKVRKSRSNDKASD